MLLVVWMMLSTLQYSSLQSRTMSNSGLCKTNNTSHGSWHVRRDRTSPSLHWDRPATARSPATKRNRPNNEIIGYFHPRLCTRARLCGIIPYTYNTNIDTTVVSSVNQSINQYFRCDLPWDPVKIVVRPPPRKHRPIVTMVVVLVRILL